jgi:arylsulfatase A
MSRRSCLLSGPSCAVLVGLALGFLFSASAADAEKSAAAEKRPNVVFVLFDDMGYGQPPCYRPGSEFKTPNLDRLAREGLRFTDAHTAASVCTPTRYGVLTGRYPSRIAQYGVLTTYSAPIIPRERTTVASLLRDNGYHTAGFGKWHLGLRWDGKPGTEDRVPVDATFRAGPTTLGFEVFQGYTHARNIGSLLGQDRVVANVAPVEVQPRLAKEIVAWIDARAQAPGPFFLYVPLSTPHTPVVPAPEYVGKSGVAGKPGDAAYGDWLFEGDAVLGQILDALDRNKLSDGTLLIAASDNGAAGRVYAPLRGCKTSIYEGGHRVPFLARWPGRIKAGAECGDVVCLNDLLATCAELIGAKLPEGAGEDSVSILPDLLGTAKEPVREATVHQSPAGDLAIRQGPWKLIFLKDGARELYNLADDLGETKDVAAAHPDVVKQLAGLMQRYVDNGRSTPGPPQKNDAAIPLDGTAKGKGKAKDRPKGPDGAAPKEDID